MPLYSGSNLCELTAPSVSLRSVPEHIPEGPGLLTLRGVAPQVFAGVMDDNGDADRQKCVSCVTAELTTVLNVLQ